MDDFWVEVVPALTNGLLYGILTSDCILWLSDVDTVENDLKLIKLAEDGQIDQSVKYIKKASSKVINKSYKEYEEKRMQRANEFITDLLISTFNRLMGGLDAIDSVENKEDDLKKDELLRGDVNNLVSSLTPYIPYLGFVSWGITVGKHVSNHILNKTETQANNEPVEDQEG